MADPAAIPDRLMPHTVTILRAATTTDRYGNEVRDWATATRTTSRAWLEQQKGSENTADRDQQRSTWLLILPLGVEISGSDRVEYEGDTFDVVGPPATYYSVRGPHHIEAELTWIEG